MKLFLPALTVLTLFWGCSYENGFSKFDLSKEEELSANSLQNSKIKHKNELSGLFQSIYLNDVYPEKYHDDEFFYISIYVKNKNGFDPNNLAQYMRLNKTAPLSVEKLPESNQFSHLLASQNDWNSYYLVSFKQQADRKMVLDFKFKEYTSDKVMYHKDEE